MSNQTAGYQDLKALWKDGLREEFSRTAIAFLILVLLAFLACTVSPDLRNTAVDQIMGIFSTKNLMTESGKISFLALFANNLQACIFVMLYGLLPYIKLPALGLGLNAGVLGVLMSLSFSEGTVLPFFVGIIPHGIIELPALLLAFSMGLYVCGQMTRRCKKDSDALCLTANLVLISRLLFLILIPMLVIAAMIEAWVTPALLLLFS